jgi:hypothetical protein
LPLARAFRHQRIHRCALRDIRAGPTDPRLAPLPRAFALPLSVAQAFVRSNKELESQAAELKRQIGVNDQRIEVCVC